MIVDVDLNISDELNITMQDADALSNVSLETGTYIVGIDPDYEKLTNKPSVNGHVLTGNKSTEELGIRIVGRYENETLTIGLL